MIQYKGTASTEAEAEKLAFSLLLQVLKVGDRQEYTVTKRTRGIFSYVLLNTGGTEAPEGWEEGKSTTPVVFIWRIDKESVGEKGDYRLYLLYDRKRLPVYWNFTRDLFFLPLLTPMVKPEDALPAEKILTREGAEFIEESIEGKGTGEGYTHNITEKELRTLQKAPVELRVYGFFDDFGEDLQTVREDIESGDFDGGVADGELLLNAMTGKTFKTEKEYLKALADYAGAEAVEKYKERLLDGYRFYKTSRFIDFLKYELYRTEDYSYIQEKYEEYASAIGYKKDYVNSILRKEDRGKVSPLEIALQDYLSGYNSTFFEGLSEKRLADFLNVPEETLRKVNTVVKSLLL